MVTIDNSRHYALCCPLALHAFIVISTFGCLFDLLSEEMLLSSIRRYFVIFNMKICLVVNYIQEIYKPRRVRQR